VHTTNDRLKELAKLFLKLGVIGFGGPAVHIAMMEEEVVRKRKWFTQQHFLDLVGATNLIPGPNSTEMTMHCGHERAGWKGLFVAGSCFILPAVIITAVFAWAYQQYGTLPAVAPFISGIKPAIIGVIVALMISLARKALKSVALGILGIIAVALALMGYNEIFILLGLGIAGMLFHTLKNDEKTFLTLTPLMPDTHTVVAKAAQWKIFLIFLKIGAILYGSGYVLFAFLDAELVEKGLLTKQQLIDAIAVGQFTPGPVFSAATFIGWQIAGLPGAIAATIGIFLPSFLFVAFLNPLIPALRRSKKMSAFLDTVNVVSVALILVVCWEMSQQAIGDWRTTVIALSGFIVAFSFKKLNTAFIVLGGAISGYLLSLF
jgi:chromate transporter, chromate ion transporter (CHR) family